MQELLLIQLTQQSIVDNWKLLYDAADKKEFEEFALYNTDLWLITYEDEVADEMGQKPAFNEPVTPKPEAAKVSAKGAEAEGSSASAGGGDEEEIDIDALMKGLPKV